MKPNFEQVFHVEIEFIPSKSFDKVKYIQYVEKIKMNLFKGNCLKNGKNVINRNNENKLMRTPFLLHSFRSPIHFQTCKHIV